MLFFLLRSPSFFPRIDFSLRMNGGQLGFSRAVDGCTMQFTVQSHILCCSGGHLTISGNRRINLASWPSDKVSPSLLFFISKALEMKVLLCLNSSVVLV
ncbi:hypothetical protein KSS87_000182 [Heliosperma pusillum]|nr:hypothetical protein KSS87_000182 [Heliosperma pusillum]